MDALIRLARSGQLWTGAQHAALARPPSPIVAQRLASDRDVALARGIVAVLVEREDTFRTPTLLRKGHGFERIMPVVTGLPHFRDATDFDRLVALLLALDLVVEVPEDELLPLAGYPGRPPGPCLPCRRYWGEGARGFRVTDRGRRMACGCRWEAPP